MTTATATVAEYKKLVVATSAILQAHQRIDRKFKDLSAKIAEAVKAGDGATCGLYLKAVDVELKLIDKTRAEARSARVQLQHLQKDDAFVEQRLEDIEKLSHIVSAADDGLLKLFPRFKRLQTDAEKQMQSLGSADAAARVELVELDKELRQAIKKIDGVLDRARAIEDKAAAAAKAHNAKAAADAQKALDALAIDRAISEYKSNEYRLKMLLIQVDDRKYSAELRADVRDGTARLLTEYGRGLPQVQFDALRKRMADLARQMSAAAKKAALA